MIYKFICVFCLEPMEAVKGPSNIVINNRCDNYHHYIDISDYSSWCLVGKKYITGYNKKHLLETFSMEK